MAAEQTAHAEHPNGSGEHNPGGRSLRVLVVDDNADAADMLGEWLMATGYEFRIARDGLEALAVASQFTPDVVLLDIGLPVMDGYEVARRLREREALARATLIAVTGYGQPSDRQRSAMAGFDEHLVKPVNLEVLARVIRRSGEAATST